MSPIPKANEPGNKPAASGDGKGEEDLEPHPQGFDSVLIAGNVSSEDEGSDDGEDSNAYGGYQLLEQDPEPEHHSADADSEDETEGTAGATGVLNLELPDEEWPQQPDQRSMANQSFQQGDSPDSARNPTQNSTHPHLPAHLAKLLPTTKPTPDLESTPHSAHTDTPNSLEQRKKNMATDDQIRAAMAGFSLPTAAIPSWARSVSEDDWRKQLVARIQNKHDEKIAASTSASTTQQKGGGENG